MEIGFTVLQHGRTPMPSLEPAPTIDARHAASGGVVTVAAIDQGPAGHYLAELALPTAGEWSWGIRAFGGGAQPMPSLVVAPADAAIARPVPLAGASPLPTTLLAAAATAAVAGMIPPRFDRRPCRTST